MTGKLRCSRLADPHEIVIFEQSALNNVPTLESLVGIDSLNESNCSGLEELADNFSSNTLLDAGNEKAVKRFSIVRGVLCSMLCLHGLACYLL